MITDKELLKLKDEVKEKKSELSDSKAKRDYILKQLKEDWGCTTIKQAQNKSKKLSEELEEINKSIELGKKEIEENYNIE